ncbi:MAG TPA: YDG domain-containing protein, partial [Chitinophagaceae bacterium]|nr:YDG domain-containing protein [Chitinophagaceae bacterium]
GNIVTIVGAGTTSITASQAGNADYLPAVDVSQNQIVNVAGLISQTITFNALPNVIYGSSPVTLTATGGASGNPITYTSSNTNVATIAGNTMTIVGAGSTVITASQAGNANYEPALDVMQTQVVDVKELTVPSASADNKVYDGNNIATISNLSLTGVVGSDNVVVTGGGTFASTNVGTAIAVSTNLVLSGTHASNYSITQPSGLTADITTAAQVIDFPAIPVKTFTSAPFALTATGGTSGNPITYISDNPLVATISGNTVTITGVGTANITASQAGDANHSAAVDVVQILTVTQATQFITFAALPNKVIGDPSFTLTGTASSTLAVTYTSSNPLVATISGNTVTLVGAGTTSITASQAGDLNYLPATDVIRTLTVTYPLIAAWDFFGQNTIATFAATTFNSNLVSASNANNITRGSAAAASAGGNSFRTVGFKNNGINVDSNDYFQTTLTATSGHSLSLSSINANFAGTASFAATPGVTSQFAYSLDGTNFTLIGSPFVTIGTPASSPLIDLTSIPALQNVHASKTVTIRYFASGQTATGGWGFISAATGTNGLAFGGSLNVCVPTTNTTNLTICSSALPYTWNSQIITTAGTYTNTGINVQGCDSNEVLVLTVNSCSSTTLNLNCFIEGYWDGTSAMLPVLMNQGQPNTATECDSITVELYNPATLPAAPPYTPDYSTVAMLNTNGTATANFTSSITGNYYIVIKHRSALQTWSASPVAMSSSVNYNFTTSASQAYGSNQVEIAPGVFALYSGDIVVDENMDLLDLGLVESDISSFIFGYASTDLNGDGNVDLLDSPILETNISLFIFSAHP